MRPHKIATIALWTLSLAMSCHCCMAAEPSQAVNSQNSQAIEDVRAGKRKEAHAAWWGYDPADATAALQAAIDSGAKKVIVEDLGTPWNVEPIQLAADQELILEKGVILQAKRGSYQRSNASLLTATGKKDIAITGPGATLRMWKQDYDRPPYKKSEFRNAIQVRSCTNVKITGLTIASSGGDGIYLGGDKNRDILIKDVVCDDNYRQGISVITAENLLIENCVLKNTGGTAPRAGIDFEPNRPTDKLVNCVMRNCVSENNQGGGYLFALPNLHEDSAPISIRLEKCRSVGNSAGLQFRTGNTAPRTGVRGTLDVIDCQFDQPRTSGIQVISKPASGAKVRFVRCQIADAAKDPAILFTSKSDDTKDLGGVEFVDCVVKESSDRSIMQLVDLAGGLRITDVTGDLTVDHDGKTTRYILDQSRIDQWMPALAIKDIPRFNTKGVRYVPAIETPPPEFHANRCYLRGSSEYLLWAVAGEKTSFSLRDREVKQGPPTVEVLSSAGAKCPLTQTTHEDETEYTFSPNETGVYRIQCTLKKGMAQVSSTDCRMCLYSDSSSFHFVGTTNELFFWVPAGTREFAVKVAGAAVRERVKVAIVDPSGHPVAEQDNIDAARQLVVPGQSDSPGEIWSLRISKPSEGVLSTTVHVELQGVPPVLALEREAILKPQ